MKVLSASLLAAQKSASRVPYVKVVARNRISGNVRFEWERLYTGTETDYYHAVTMPGDGSMVRVRVNPAGENFTLYWQRVTNPGPQSDFSQWTYTGQSGCLAVAAASHGAEVSILWVNLDQQLKHLQSNDYGATWGTAQIIDMAPAAWTFGLAAAYKPNGDVTVFFTSENILYVKKRAVGNWQDKAAWDKTTGNLTSVTAVYDGDFCLMVTGQDSSENYKVWSLVYGDGGRQSAGTWSDLREPATAPANGDFEYSSVFLDKPDIFRTLYIEKYTGLQSYSRPYRSNTVLDTAFIDGLWCEPCPFNLSSVFGLAMAHHGDYCWLSTPNGLWRASLTVRERDLTTDVTEARCEVQSDDGRIIVSLKNDDGGYNQPGTGDLEVVDIGCELEFSPGYITERGNESSSGSVYWLEGFEHNSEGGRASLLLHGIDGWGLLKRWSARHQFRWNKEPDRTAVRGILAFVLARVGLKLEVQSESSVVTSFYPDFTIHPGDNGAAIIRKLLSFVPDVLRFEGARVILVYPQSTDSSVYSYGAGHPVFKGRYLSAAWGTNGVRVRGYAVETGETLLVDSFDWEQGNMYPERFKEETDRNIITVEQAEERGGTVLRRAEIASVDGAIIVPVNCGQQLYDVIDITDSRAGLSSAKRRVLGITLRYLPGRGVYEQQLTLGGV